MLEHTFTRRVTAAEMEAPKDCCGTNMLLAGVVVDALLKLAVHTPCLTLASPSTLVVTTGYDTAEDGDSYLYVKVSYVCDQAECRAKIEET